MLAATATALASCPPQTGVKMQGAVRAPFEVYLASPASIPLSAPFQVEIAVCATNTGAPENVTVDAIMPAHNHGMNYEPEISALGAGKYEVKGLLFHMPGIWRFEVTAYHGGKPHRFSHDVKVP